MTAEHTAIKTAYEDSHMMPDEIASDRGLEVTAVKACLMQCSSQYRKDCGLEAPSEDRLNFSKDEQERVKEMMLSLALSAENEKVRASMCTYIRDDSLGRKDVMKGLAGQSNNIFLINQQMARVREVADRVKNVTVISNPPPLELQPA